MALDNSTTNLLNTAIRQGNSNNGFTFTPVNLEVDNGFGGNGNSGPSSTQVEYVINIQTPVGYKVFVNDIDSGQIIPTILSYRPEQLLNGLNITCKNSDGTIVSNETYILKTNPIVGSPNGGGTDDFGNPIGPNGGNIQ